MDQILDRIKKVLEIIKEALLYVLLPVGAIISYILYKKAESDDKKAGEHASKAEEALHDALIKKEFESKEANDAVANYESIRDSFLRGGDK